MINATIMLIYGGGEITPFGVRQHKSTHRRVRSTTRVKTVKRVGRRGRKRKSTVKKVKKSEKSQEKKIEKKKTQCQKHKIFEKIGTSS